MVQGLTFRSSPTQGYFIQPLQEELRGVPKHQLGCSTELSVECKGCGERLVRVLRLDTSDTRIALPNHSPFLELLLCPACSSNCYSVGNRCECLPRVPSSAIKVVPKFRGPPSGPVALHAIPERIREIRILAKEGRLDEAGNWVKQYDWQRPIHQVGGDPVLWGEPITPPDCWLCDAEMPYLASIVATDAPELTTPHETTIAQQVVFFICRNCLAIVARRDMEKVD